MKRIGTAGLLAAVLALAALSAASVASAAGNPEYQGCLKAKKNATTKKYEGKYSEKTCAKEASSEEQAEGKHNKYERGPATFPIKTKSKFGLTTVYIYNPLEHKLESEVPCEKGGLAGSIINSREQTFTLTYTGCIIPKEFKNGQKAKFLGPCWSPGKSEKKAEIVSQPLAAKLVWLNEAETEPGIVVTPAESGGAFEEVLCFLGKAKIKQTGSILARIAPEGELTKALTATFTASSQTGEPELTTYWEGGLPNSAALFSEILVPEYQIDYPAVPTAETSTIAEKTGKVLIGG